MWQRVDIEVWNSSRGYLQSLPRSFGADDAMAASSQIELNDPHSGAVRAWRTGRTVWSNTPEEDLPAQRACVQAIGIRWARNRPLEPRIDRDAGVVLAHEDPRAPSRTGEQRLRDPVVQFVGDPLAFLHPLPPGPLLLVALGDRGEGDDGGQAAESGELLLGERCAGDPQHRERGFPGLGRDCRQVHRGPSRIPHRLGPVQQGVTGGQRPDRLEPHATC